MTPRRHLLATMLIGPASLIALPTAAVASPTAAGTIIEFPFALGTGAHGIAPGPDSNLWFTERSIDNIAKVTPTGTITGFAAPTAFSDLRHHGWMNARP